MARLTSDLVLTLHDKVSGAAKQIDLSLDKLSRRQGTLGGSMAASTGATTKAGAALGMYARSAAMAAAPVAAALGAREVVVAAAQFESALTNIQKKAGTTAEQTRQLGEDIKDLATSGKLASPIEDIAAAYERGAAAGIPLDDLKTFATLSAKAADAFEMSATDVGNSAAGFNTVLKIPMDQMQQYFDLINGLADSGIADESGIVNYIDRAGSMGKTFGLVPREIAAIGASLANLKVPAEKAATATNSIFTKLLAPGALSKSARKAFGHVVKDQKKLQSDLANGNASGAFVDILESLKAMNNEARAGYVSDLFGQEHLDTVMQMVEGLDEVKRNLAYAGDDSKWLGSLDKSYQLKLSNMESQWQLFQNNLKTLTIDLGTLILPPGKDFLADASGALQGLNDTIKGVTTSYNILSSALSGSAKTPGGFDPKSWSDNLWPDMFNKKRLEANAQAAITEKALAEKSPGSGAVGAQASRNMDGVLLPTAVAGLRNTFRKLTSDTPGEQNDRREFIKKQQPAEQYDPGSAQSYRDWLQQKRVRDKAAAEAARLSPMPLPQQADPVQPKTPVPLPQQGPVPVFRPNASVTGSGAFGAGAGADASAAIANLATAIEAASIRARIASENASKEGRSFTPMADSRISILERRLADIGAAAPTPAPVVVDTAAMDAAVTKATSTGAAITQALLVTARPEVDVTGISYALDVAQQLASVLRSIPGLSAQASQSASQGVLNADVER